MLVSSSHQRQPPCGQGSSAPVPNRCELDAPQGTNGTGTRQISSCELAVLLVRNLSEALHGRRIEIADSELHWLVPGQYEEGDWGIRFFPSRAPELIQYARQNNFRPLGIVILAENGDFSDFMNDNAIPTGDL